MTPSRGLALPPPPLILTSPQAATIDLLYSPSSDPPPRTPSRLVFPPSTSSSSSARAAPGPSSKGVQETRKLLHHLIDRLEERGDAEGVFEKALKRERKTVGLDDANGNDARDKAREDEVEQTMQLVEQLRDILIISGGMAVFEDSHNDHHLGPTVSSSDPLPPRLLPLLSSLFSHEGLHPTAQPRLTRPPHALQSTLLDICTLLIHAARLRREEQTVLALGAVAMEVWAGLGPGGLGGPDVLAGGIWGERVLRFWESFLRGGLVGEPEKGYGNQERDARVGLGLRRTTFNDTFAGGADGLNDRGGPSQGWHLHASPTSSHFPPHSGSSQKNPLTAYQLLDSSHSTPTSSTTSLVPSLLHHILQVFTLPLSSPLLATVFRIHSLIDLIVARKPDLPLDLLQIVAHGSSTARFGALSLLSTFWPKTMGHLDVGKAFPSFEYSKDLYQMGRAAASEPHDRRHHWIPWLVPSALPSLPSERVPLTLCRSCSHPAEGFVLHCTHCLDFIHHSCYHPTSSTSIIRYPSPSASQTPLTATLTFCKVPPTRLGPTEQIERDLEVRTDFWSGEHHFRLSNLFSLTLCSLCRLPLWGVTSQAYRCSGPCAIVAHPKCLGNVGGRLGRCRPLKPTTESFALTEKKLRESFVDEFSSILFSETDLSSSSTRPSFEEAAVVVSVLRLQLELFKKGIGNGTVVLDASEKEPRFELHETTERLRKALVSGDLERSKVLSELIDLERTDSSDFDGLQLAERIVFSRTFLSLVVLTLKTPSPPNDSSTPNMSGSNLLQVVRPDPPSSSSIDPSSHVHPLDAIPLSQLISRLSSTLGVTSQAASTAFLSHLHALGSFQRQDGQAALFPLGSPFSPLPTRTSQDPICSFIFPQGVDDSPIQVQLLVSAIEACLTDLSIATNEVGLGLMSRLCMPSGSSQNWVMDRLTAAVIKWVLEEEDRLIVIARDFVSLSKTIPGLADILEGDFQGPVPSATLSKEDFFKAAASRGPNKVGEKRILGVNDYKIARRLLIDRHVSNWLLSLHNCDRKLYAESLWKACAIPFPRSHTEPSSTFSPAASASEDILRERVELVDLALRNTIKLASQDLVFSVFDEILSVFMDELSSLSTTEKPVPFKSLPRLFNRSKTSRAQSRMSTASMSDELQGFDVFTAQSVDPWRVLMEVVDSGSGGLMRGLRWLTVLAQSMVSIPLQNLLSISTLVASDASFETAVEFSEACFASSWFGPAGKQDLVFVVSDLLAQQLRALERSFENGVDTERSLRFLLRVLGSFLLLYGCPREQLVRANFVENDAIFGDSKGNVSRSMSRYLVVTRSLEVRFDVVEALQRLFQHSPSASVLVGEFLLGLLTKSAHVQALNLFIEQRIDLLLDLTWHLFETEAVPTSTRISLLIRILSSDKSALQGFLSAKFEEGVDVQSKCSSLDTLFLIIMELNGDEPAALDSDWRATVVEVFFRFFASLWDQRDERVRSQATVLSASLYPSHFDLASQSFEAFLDQADSSERTRSISFLIHVHSYFPRWRVLNWSVVWNLLFEEEFNIEQHSKASGGGRQSTYEMDNLPDDPATAMVEAEHLRILLLDLVLLWIGDGIQIDLFSVLKVKYHVIKTLGFEHCEIVPFKDGLTFCIQFSNLPRFGPSALTVVSGLKRALDCSSHLGLAPSAMGVYLEEDHTSSHLVGAAFVDVVISVVNSKVGILSLPYLEQRCWFECILIVVYKHDFDSDSLAHLEAPLLEALKTITYFSPSVSPDCQQIVLTTCNVLLEQWDEGVVAKVVSRLITNIARLLKSLGLDSSSSLAVQARSFIRLALKKFGERGVYLLQFKEASDLNASDAGFELFSTLTAVFSTPSELHRVYQDAMRSLLSVNIPRSAFSSILISLHSFSEIVPPTRLSPELLAEFGTFFNRVARHTSTWKQGELDPNPLLLVAAAVITGSRGKGATILPDVLTLLQAFLARFDVTTPIISRVFTACAEVSPSDGRATTILLDAAEAGLRRTSKITLSTLGALLESLVSFPPSGPSVDSRQPALDPTRLRQLAPLALTFLATSPPASHSAVLLSAARLVLAANGLDSSILGQFLVDQMSTDHTPDHLRVYNHLALAALTHSNPTHSRRLLNLTSFSTYACSSTILLASEAQDPSRPDRSAEHLSAAFAFLKLWLLLARRGRAVDVEDGVVVEVHAKRGERKEGEIWDACWPSWEKLLRLSKEETRRTPISTVLHSIFTDLCIFIAHSNPSLLFATGPSLEHHLLLVRELASTKLVALKITKALSLVRSWGSGQPGAGIAVEVVGAADDLKAAERLRSLGGL